MSSLLQPFNTNIGATYFYFSPVEQFLYTHHDTDYCANTYI